MTGSPNLGGGGGFNNHLNMVNTVNLSLNPGHMSPRGSSPGPSPSTRRRPHHHLQNLVLGSSPRSHHGHSNQQQTQNHSSSPVSCSFGLLTCTIVLLLAYFCLFSFISSLFSFLFAFLKIKITHLIICLRRCIVVCPPLSLYLFACTFFLSLWLPRRSIWQSPPSLSTLDYFILPR
jgi:hypothetical protein